MLVERIVPFLVLQVLRAHVRLRLSFLRLVLGLLLILLFLLLFQVLVEFHLGINIHLLIEVFEQELLLLVRRFGVVVLIVWAS